VIATSILPAFFLTLASQLVLILICCFGMQIRVVRVPATLILSSTTLDVLTSYLTKSQLSVFGDVKSWLPSAGQIIDIVGELLSVVGVAWLLVIVVRQRAKISYDMNPAAQAAIHK
jgi:hypothetical protein